MSEFPTQLISGLTGAVTGGFSGAFIGLLIAPTRAEREERGKRRVEGRRQIAAALSELSYELIEARGRLFRLEGASDRVTFERLLRFTGEIQVGASSLPRFERWRIERKARALTGKLAWRLAAIVPPSRYDNVDEASLIKATADTRTSNEVALLNMALATARPTDPRWDAALKALERLRRAYPA